MRKVPIIFLLLMASIVIFASQNVQLQVYFPSNFLFDKVHTIIKETFAYDDDDTKRYISKSISEYDTAGHILKTTFYDKQDQISDTYVYQWLADYSVVTYLMKKLILIKITYTSDFQLANESLSMKDIAMVNTDFFYDSQRRIVKAVHHYPGKSDTVEYFDYDSGNNIEKIRKYTANKNNEQLNGVTLFYADGGLVLKSVYYEKDKPVEEIQYDYTENYLINAIEYYSYDNDGINKVLRTMTKVEYVFY